MKEDRRTSILVVEQVKRKDSNGSTYQMIAAAFG
jgi:hypothetical protein